jgi:hypothetical protein
LPWFGGQERIIMIAAGFLGGIVSARVGTGVNSVAFMVMVLLFRINEKIVTPTTVISDDDGNDPTIFSSCLLVKGLLAGSHGILARISANRSLVPCSLHQSGPSWFAGCWIGL